MFKILMPNNWTAFAFRRPVTVFMVLVSFILFGAVSYNLLPLEFIPAKDGVWMNIWVPYPNSTPEDNVRLLVKPLEEEMKTLRGILRIQGNTHAGGANLNLRFDFDTDMKLAYAEVRDRVERVRPLLPDDVDRIWVRKQSSTDIPIMYLAMSWDGEQETLYQVADEQIRHRIERIKGVAGLDVWGAASRQVIIDLDEDRLKAHNVDMERFVNAMERANMDSPGGYVEEGGYRYLVRLTGAFLSVNDIRNFPINEAGLRLSDVAEVAYRQPTRQFRYRLNSQAAIGMVIRKESNANTVELTAAVRETLDELTSDPRWPGLTYFVFFEQSAWILTSLNGLKTAGMWGGLFAVGVLFFFLRRYRSTLIVAAAMPASILVTFTAMYFINARYEILSLNIISLMGLMLSIGMLVDNAVVVIENILRLRRQGMAPEQAAVQGAREVSVAVTAATLTTAIVFLPLLFIGGGGAQTEMRELGLVIAVALLSSLVMSLSFIPLLAAKFLKHDTVPQIGLFDAMERKYGDMLNWILHHRFDVFLILVGFLIVTFAVPMAQVKTSDEAADERQIWMHIHPGHHVDMAFTERFVDNLEKSWMAGADSLNLKAIRSDFRAGHINFELFLKSGGDTSPWENLLSLAGTPWVWGSLAACAILLFMLRRHPHAFQIAAVTTGIFLAILAIIGTQGGDGKYRPTKDIAQSLRKMIPEVPGLEINWRWGNQGGNDPRVSIALSGEDTRRLEAISEDVKFRLSQIPEITTVTTDLDDAESPEEVQISIDRILAGKHNLTPLQIARMTLSGIRGREMRRLRTTDREIRVWLQSEEADRRTVDQLRNQSVFLDGGGQVPLATMASFSQGPVLGSVYRQDSQTILMVRANTTTDGIKTLGDKISKSMASLSLPRGYSWKLGERWEQLEEDTEAMEIAIWLAIVSVLLLLGALFESYIDPLIIILVSIPFAYFGCYWMLYATGTNLTVLALIGIVILIGVVVNNAIVFIDHIKHLEREGRLEGHEILIQAGRDRLRPILMTALTTMLGLLPLAIGNAAIGNQPYYPMGRAVMGGLAFSTIGAMIALPFVYSTFKDLRAWGQGIVARMRRPE